jgi:hypothetical protein
MTGISFIDASNNYLGAQNGALLLYGKWQLSGASWQFDSTSLIANTSGGTPIVAGLAGSGTLNTRVSYSGTYGLISPTLPILDNYSNANALAVSQSDLAGRCASGGLAVDVNSAGVFTGRWTAVSVGDCVLNGTAALATPGSAKNLYAISLTATPASGASCTLSAAGTYAGFAAITFVNNGTPQSPNFVRAVTLLVRLNASFFAAELPRS